MNSDLVQFTKLLKVNNNDAVYCPFSKTKNMYKNISGVPTPHTLTGDSFDKICVPNSSDINNTPYHITFDNQSTECYIDPACTQKLETG